MGRLLRKIRGLVGTALTWGAAWAAATFLVLSVVFFFLGNPAGRWETIRPLTILAGLAGAMGGTTLGAVTAAATVKIAQITA